jgi:hypothetical protein
VNAGWIQKRDARVVKLGVGPQKRESPGEPDGHISSNSKIASTFSLGGRLRERWRLKKRADNDGWKIPKQLRIGYKGSKPHANY